MSDLRTARAAAEGGARLTREDALLLYEDNDLLALAHAIDGQLTVAGTGFGRFG